MVNQATRGRASLPRYLLKRSQSARAKDGDVTPGDRLPAPTRNSPNIVTALNATELAT